MSGPFLLVLFTVTASCPEIALRASQSVAKRSLYPSY